MVIILGIMPAAAQTPALRIVVIAGEDAVNIIQQKTAVAPVVEVRDRNDLPVAGATVTFTLTGGNATFAGGAQTLAVTTNAAGRAAAAALNPVASGAVQVNVQAAFQGQTAIATITQTNVLTSAQASTGASGASGGTSIGKIALVGTAVAGGAAAVVVAADSEEPPPAPVANLAGTWSGDVPASSCSAAPPLTSCSNFGTPAFASPGTITATLSQTGSALSGVLRFGAIDLAVTGTVRSDGSVTLTTDESLASIQTGTFAGGRRVTTNQLMFRDTTHLGIRYDHQWFTTAGLEWRLAGDGVLTRVAP
jgi:hypothetical protein